MGAEGVRRSMGTKGARRKFLSTLHPNTISEPNPHCTAHPNPKPSSNPTPAPSRTLMMELSYESSVR